jgi:two-component system nitrogen regulation response regulator GlnG
MPSELAPALTIVWHPDPSRIGAMFSFADLAEGQAIPLSRLSPEFAAYTDSPGPLADFFLSRKPCLKFIPTKNGVRILPVATDIPVQIDGQTLSREVTLPADPVRSFILSLARRIVLCLHAAAPPTRSPSDDLGLLGHGDAINTVRRAVRSVADLDIPVLIRGETGTGKELTAVAIAKASRRADKPFVAISMASLPPTMAVAEMFGHEKGAFTDAADSRKGYFLEADGGTLFLDEIGLAIPDVQTALLRVLETGEVRSLGSRRGRPVNVRVIAATDVKLEERVRAGVFSEPLFHRLSSFQIHLAPLRERRQDIGVLFLHFLKAILKETGDLSKLQLPVTAKRPWLTGDVMTQVALAPWTGNVRQLRNFAIQLAVANRGASAAHLDPTLQSLLAGPGRGVSDPAVGAPKTEGQGPLADRAPISHDKLLDALERNDFKIASASRDLGISRTTMYALIRRDPELRKASELRRLRDEFQGDIDQLAKRLRVSLRALQLRLHRSA